MGNAASRQRPRTPLAKRTVWRAGWHQPVDIRRFHNPARRRRLQPYMATLQGAGAGGRHSRWPAPQQVDQLEEPLPMQVVHAGMQTGSAPDMPDVWSGAHAVQLQLCSQKTAPSAFCGCCGCHPIPPACPLRWSQRCPSNAYIHVSSGARPQSMHFVSLRNSSSPADSGWLYIFFFFFCGKVYR